MSEGSVRIKVDEDLPLTVAALLREAGHEAETVLEEGLQGWKDPDLWRVVQEEGRFLVTADKGFADIRAFPPGTHAGVLLLRPDEDGIRPLIELMEQVMSAYHLSALSGLLVVATPRGVRIRGRKRN
ncbi:hypothetical protein D6833_02995 [Candidatus Parcubacteria bacterium]|nr:MAG: hypothetical protein D6833_02995 [Candidatus Parcubacteria bacterium]